MPAPPPTKPAPAFATAVMGDSFDAFEAKFSQAAAPSGGDAFGDAFGSSVITTDSGGGDLNSGMYRKYFSFFYFTQVT